MGLVTYDPYGQRSPPADAQRELQEAFPECSYYWMNACKRWGVQRKVPWHEVDDLVQRGLITEADIFAYVEQRFIEGYKDPGADFVVHAFTVQDPDTGEPLEPSSGIVEAMRKADTQQHPRGVMGAVKDSIDAAFRREAEVDAMIKDGIEQVIESWDYRLRQNPRINVTDDLTTENDSAKRTTERVEETNNAANA